MIVVVSTDSGMRLAELVRPGLVRLEGLELAVPPASYTRLARYRGAARATIARAVSWRTPTDRERPRA